MAPGACEAVTCQMPNPPTEPMVASVRACVDNAGYDCDMPLARGGNNECHEDNNQVDGSQGCSGVPQ